MTNLERFQAYADAFEATYADDDWQRLEEYFTTDAVYAPGDGTDRYTVSVTWSEAGFATPQSYAVTFDR